MTTPALESTPQAVSQVYTWEPSNAAIAERYGLRPEQILRFDTNTSPVAPALARAVLSGSFEPPLNEYPDSEYRELTDAIAMYAGVDPGEVVVGAGADEILDLVGKAWLREGDTAIVPVPTYAMYGVLSSQRGARVAPVARRPADEAFALDSARLVEALPEARVVWLCAPNNPTGTQDDLTLIEAAIAEAAKLPGEPLVVVDEAYHEFVGETVVGLRARYPNLLVVRTLSKAFALAGIRVGYGIAARDTIARLERVRPPGSISTVSAAVAAAAIRAPDLARERVTAIALERDRLARGLSQSGWQALPSVTNFLLVRVGDHQAAEAAADRLLRSGIVPRTFGPANPLRGYLRLTVRSREENDRLLEIVAR